MDKRKVTPERSSCRKCYYYLQGVCINKLSEHYKEVTIEGAFCNDFVERPEIQSK